MKKSDGIAIFVFSVVLLFTFVIATLFFTGHFFWAMFTILVYIGVLLLMRRAKFIR